MELAQRLDSGGHGDVVGVEGTVVDHRLGPICLAFVLREQVGEFPVGLVGSDPGVGLDRQGRPGEGFALLRA